MTSSVKISAHCSSDKEVLIEIKNFEYAPFPKHITLQNGDNLELSFYDGIKISVSEIKKDEIFP